MSHSDEDNFGNTPLGNSGFGDDSFDADFGDFASESEPAPSSEEPAFDADFGDFASASEPAPSSEEPAFDADFGDFASASEPAPSSEEPAFDADFGDFASASEPAPSSEEPALDAELGSLENPSTDETGSLSDLEKQFSEETAPASASDDTFAILDQLSAESAGSPDSGEDTSVLLGQLGVNSADTSSESGEDTTSRLEQFSDEFSGQNAVTPDSNFTEEEIPAGGDEAELPESLDDLIPETAGGDGFGFSGDGASGDGFSGGLEEESGWAAATMDNISEGGSDPDEIPIGRDEKESGWAAAAIDNISDSGEDGESETEEEEALPGKKKGKKGKASKKQKQPKPKAEKQKPKKRQKKERVKAPRDIQVRLLNLVWGFLFVYLGCGNFMGIWESVKMKDEFGSFNLPFFLIAFNVVGIVLLVAAPLLKAKKRRYGRFNIFDVMLAVTLSSLIFACHALIFEAAKYF